LLSFLVLLEVSLLYIAGRPDILTSDWSRGKLSDFKDCRSFAWLDWINGLSLERTEAGRCIFDQRGRIEINTLLHQKDPNSSDTSIFTIK
ncbi:hypothetical protein BDR26DRAFT_857928, partial [Obelidium mucronatum]